MQSEILASLGLVTAVTKQKSTLLMTTTFEQVQKRHSACKITNIGREDHNRWNSYKETRERDRLSVRAGKQGCHFACA